MKAIALAICLASISLLPGCGLIALTAMGVYVYDHPNGPPDTHPRDPQHTEPEAKQ